MIALLPHRVALLVPMSYLLLALLAQATPLTAVLGAAKAQTQNFYLLAAPIKSSDDPAAEILDLIKPFYQAKFMLRISGRSLYRQFNLTSLVPSCVVRLELKTTIVHALAVASFLPGPCRPNNSEF
jgi:hypothetical protein